MGSQKSEFPTQCWGGGPFFIKLFLDCLKKKGGGVIYLYPSFFLNSENQCKKIRSYRRQKTHIIKKIKLKHAYLIIIYHHLYYID